jgi:hypothetical protein
MRCQAELILGTVEDAVTVPVQAVFSDGPVRYVLAPEGGRYARLPVNLGRRSDLHAQIVAGLDEGTSVLLRDPKAGEVIEQPWDADQLTAAGYSLDDDGNPIAPRRRRPGMRPGGGGGPPAGIPTTSGTPQKPESAAAKPDTKPETKPDSEAVAETASTETATSEAGEDPSGTPGTETAEPVSEPVTEPVTEPAGEPAVDPAG